MNKRLGLLSMFGITAILLAMVGAITAMAAPSAATVTGTITLNKTWYTVGSEVTVTVTDNDAVSNILTAKTGAAVNIGGVGGLATGTAKRVTLGFSPVVGTPVAVSPGTSTAIVGLDVVVISSSLGIVDVYTSVDRAVDYTIDIQYNISAKDTQAVTFKSTQDPTTGITVNAVETEFNTGIFKVTITLADTASSSTTKTLRSANGDLVTAEFTDPSSASGGSVKVTSVASKVETQKTTFSSLLPADKFRTTATQVTFTGTVTDTGGSGVDISSIKLNIGGTDNSPTTITGNSGDATVTYSFTLATPAIATYSWYTKASDVAGNPGRSDSKTSTPTVDDNHTLDIDKTAPKITSATTGKYWDLSKSVPAEASNKLTSLAVTFDADLDTGSVQAADFTVTGMSVTAADIYTDSAGVGKNKVYLTLGGSIARDAVPTVAITSGQSVADIAGNVLGAGSADATTTAVDGIAPSFAFTLDKTVTKDTVVATVTSTETVAGGTFSVKAYPAATIAGGVVTDFAIEVTGTNAWKATFTKVAGKDGKYSVQVAGKDVAGNNGTAGKDSTTDPAATTFTQDTAVPAPVFEVGLVNFTAVADGGPGPKDVEGASPLVSVNFGEAVTITRAAFGESGSAVDVLAIGTQSTDKKTWLYQASGLTVGKVYQVIVSATDLAGNKASDKTATFNTIAVKLPETPLKPGQNLISFTGNPVNGAINTVFADAAVTAVVTYDSATGAFQTAVRGADGKLSGTLTKIDGQHAYFVKSSAFGSVKVEIAKLGFDAAPSVIAVKKGWNLVSVVSAEGKSPLAAGGTCAGTPTSCVSADGYLSTIKWVTAYTYDPVANGWTKLQPKTFANLELGRGYWVYVTEDGVLVP